MTKEEVSHLLRVAAKGGHVEAQFWLGLRQIKFQKRDGPRESELIDKGICWLTETAAQGNLDAM